MNKTFRCERDSDCRTMTIGAFYPPELGQYMKEKHGSNQFSIAVYDKYWDDFFDLVNDINMHRQLMKNRAKSS